MERGERRSVLGAEQFVGSLADAAEAVIARAHSGEGGYAVLCNVHVLVSARDRPDLQVALNEAWAVFPDGAPVAWLARRFGSLGARRIAGVDLMVSVLAEPGLRHVLFGSTPVTLARLQARLESDFPQAVVATALSPPFGEVGEEWVDEIRAARPDIVWCGLGAPKQELWLRRHAGALAPAVCLGVGAAFDFLAESKPRAPAWMQRASLEWLHRLLDEPRRLGGRYLRANTTFVVVAARELARHRRKK